MPHGSRRASAAPRACRTYYSVQTVCRIGSSLPSSSSAVALSIDHNYASSIIVIIHHRQSSSSVIIRIIVNARLSSIGLATDTVEIALTRQALRALIIVLAHRTTIRIGVVPTRAASRARTSCQIQAALAHQTLVIAIDNTRFAQQTTLFIGFIPVFVSAAHCEVRQAAEWRRNVNTRSRVRACAVDERTVVIGDRCAHVVSVRGSAGLGEILGRCIASE